MEYRFIHPDQRIVQSMMDTVKDRLGIQCVGFACTLEESVAAGIQHDALITPGNSYGDMTGGFDQAVVNVLGSYVQDLVHRRIAQAYFGELNVGQADLVPLSPSYPFKNLVYAPTMRVPMKLHWNSDVPYLSLLASFQAIRSYNRQLDDMLVTLRPEHGYLHPIESVLFTLHGHGVGQLPVERIIEQTVAAINQIEKQPQRTIGIGDGMRFNAQLRGHGE